MITNDESVQNTIDKSVPAEIGLKYKNNFKELSDAKRALRNKQIDSIFYMDLKSDPTTITYWRSNYKVTNYQNRIINYLTKMNMEKKIIDSNISNQEKNSILNPIKIKEIPKVNSKSNISSAVIVITSLLESVKYLV